MKCPDCGADKMAVARTFQTTKRTTRILHCDCGSGFESEESIVAKISRSKPGHESPPVIAGDPPVIAGSTPVSARGSPVITGAPRKRRGVGGDLSTIPSLFGSDLVSATRDPLGSGSDVRAPERDPTAPPEYPEAFLAVWIGTGRRGTKDKALRAWRKAGRPSWEDVSPAWAAYMLSDDPSRGFVQHMSTWFNGKGHTQEWMPARRTNGHTRDPRIGRAEIGSDDDLSKVGRLS